jgi:hypothetical protein
MNIYVCILTHRIVYCIGNIICVYFNGRMRESTLMSLIYIVDKLDEVHLQDRLVRCVLNLQGDSEASIRTNTVIFIGKIAHKLKESVRHVLYMYFSLLLIPNNVNISFCRQRVLCSALTKAMKDNFVHCRYNYHWLD